MRTAGTAVTCLSVGHQGTRKCPWTRRDLHEDNKKETGTIFSKAKTMKSRRQRYKNSKSDVFQLKLIALWFSVKISFHHIAKVQFLIPSDNTHQQARARARSTTCWRKRNKPKSKERMRKGKGGNGKVLKGGEVRKGFKGGKERNGKKGMGREGKERE
eukprot:768821-Hanusia_phi.AAC.5